jgi:hypothetical protein
MSIHICVTSEQHRAHVVCLLPTDWAGRPMSDASHLQSKTYAGRAWECRWLATICPEDLKERYLELAEEYERLVKLNQKPH